MAFLYLVSCGLTGWAAFAATGGWQIFWIAVSVLSAIAFLCRFFGRLADSDCGPSDGTIRDAMFSTDGGALGDTGFFDGCSGSDGD